jgi:TRAP-type transport system periplasmic protein
MSLEQLAQVVGISVPQLSKIENGKTTASIPSLVKLGRELKRPVAYFLQTDSEVPRCLGTLVPRWDTEGAAIQRFADLVKEGSNGELSIAVFSGSQLGTATGQVDGLINGLIDVFVENLGFFSRHADVARIISLPFCFLDEDHYLRFKSSALFERELRQVLRDKSVELLGENWNWRRGPQLVIVAKQPIWSPADLKGIRIRSPENVIFSKYLAMLGADPVVVPWSDVSDAFAAGTFDALITNLSHVVSMRFTRIARHVTLLKYRPLDLSFAMNVQRYQMLVPSFQNALEDAAFKAGKYCSELLDATSQQLNQQVEEDEAVVSRVSIRPWQTESRNTIAKLEQQGYWRPGLFDAISAL